MNEANEKIKQLQQELDGITDNGFWCYVSEGDSRGIMLMPYALTVLAAQPVFKDGSIDQWKYAVLIVDRGFAEVGASVHGHHLHVIDKIKWRRNGNGRIYSASLRDPIGEYEITINEIDASEDPDEAARWQSHQEQLEVIPQRVNECLATLLDEYRPMAEGMLRG